MSFIGAIDGTHVKLRTPRGADAHQYINQKGVPSINVSVSYLLGVTINAIFAPKHLLSNSHFYPTVIGMHRLCMCSVKHFRSQKINDKCY